MKTLFKKAILATSIAAAVGVASQASAISSSVTGQGDLLFNQSFVATGGWETTLTVKNTSQYYSTTVKAILKSAQDSCEILDFMIYLTPGDTWTGTIRQTEGGVLPEVYSNDDSVLHSLQGSGSSETPNFASAEEPATYSIIPLSARTDLPANCQDDTENFGYVDFIGNASFAIDQGDRQLTNIQPQFYYYLPVAKETLFAKDKELRTQTISTFCNQITSGNLNTPVQDICLDAMNTLSGTSTLKNSQNGLAMTVPMETYRDYDNNVGLSIFDKTVLGQFSSTTLSELEHALAKQNVAIPYKNSGAAGDMKTMVFNMFPSKQNEFFTAPYNYAPFDADVIGVATTIRNTQELVLDNACRGGSTSNITSPPTIDPECPAPLLEALPLENNIFFMYDKIFEVAAKEYNRTWPPFGETEIPSTISIANPTDVAAVFAEGWANIEYPNTGRDTYTGAPVVPSYIQWSANSLGAGLTGSWLRPVYGTCDITPRALGIGNTPAMPNVNGGDANLGASCGAIEGDHNVGIANVR